MYLDFFQLTEKPFSETPDPGFLFLSSGHRQALLHLETNLAEGKGFTVLVGEVGTGKTTLCKALLSRLDPGQFTAVHLIHSDLDFPEFLQAVVEELGLSPPGPGKWALLKTLNRHLIASHAQNQKTVILIDEAQHLNPMVLEGIRMLSNWETDASKMIQVVFIGQPGFLDLIRRPDLTQLKQRIAGRYHLGPLTQEETHGYIDSRLHRVQKHPSPLFTPEAKDEVYRISRGIPRLINFLCDHGLTLACGLQTQRIESGLIHEAYRLMEGMGSFEIHPPFQNRNPSLALPPRVMEAIRWNGPTRPQPTPALSGTESPEPDPCDPLPDRRPIPWRILWASAALFILLAGGGVLLQNRSLLTERPRPQPQVLNIPLPAVAEQMPPENAPPLSFGELGKRPATSDGEKNAGPTGGRQ